MALRLAIACEARPLVAFCDTTLCGIHARRSDQGRAKEFEAAATAIYRELGMQPLPLNPRVEARSVPIRNSNRITARHTRPLIPKFASLRSTRLFGLVRILGRGPSSKPVILPG